MSKNDLLGNAEKLKAEIKLGDKDFKVEISKDGTLIVNGEATSINGFGKSGKREVRKYIKEIVLRMTKQLKLTRSTEKYKLLVIELRKLKALGFLKQGGKITDSQINNFLRQYK